MGRDAPDCLLSIGAATMATVAGEQSARGRGARKPQQIPGRGWRDVLLRTKDHVLEDNLSLIAAGVAFYAVLALFPGLAAVVSLYGLLNTGHDVVRQFEDLAVMLPVEARPIVVDQVRSLAESPDTALGVTVIGGLLFALVSAMKGMKALITALNVAYKEREKRGFVRLNLLAFVLTVAAVLFMVVLLGLVVAVPAAITLLNLSGLLGGMLSLVRWLVLLAAILAGLSALYHFAPSRHEPRWQWVSWGAAAATLLWLLASLGFSIYVENFGNYNKVYGSVGALVILLMWLFISAFAVLLGAELNAEMEHQTGVDTTTGEAKPMGKRQAYVADTIGEPR